MPAMSRLITPDRRTFLLAGGATAAAGTLTGCGPATAPVANAVAPLASWAMRYMVQQLVRAVIRQGAHVTFRRTISRGVVGMAAREQIKQSWLGLALGKFAEDIISELGTDYLMALLEKHLHSDEKPKIWIQQASPSLDIYQGTAEFHYHHPEDLPVSMETVLVHEDGVRQTLGPIRQFVLPATQTPTTFRYELAAEDPDFFGEAISAVRINKEASPDAYFLFERNASIFATDRVHILPLVMVS